MDFHTYNNETKIKEYGFITKRPPAHQMNDRSIVSNIPDMNVPDNSIRTSKYTLVNFIPLNLLEQFSKLANVYFLVIGIMQMINAISITNGKPVIFGPLAIVVSISMIKDFVEDYKRRKSDAEENNRTATLFQQGAKDVIWSELRIGDLIRVNQNEPIPADLLIVKTADPKGNAFVETKNLDGETNLKNKNLHKDMKYLQEQNDSALEAMRMVIKYERPNQYLYRFSGSAEMNNKSIPLDDKNVMLRGCYLRNVRFIYGIVLYNGHDTKIMLNSVKAQPKKSHLEVAMNWFIILIFIIQMIMCFCAALINTFWQMDHNHHQPYLDIAPNDPENAFTQNLFIKWGNWVLIFTNFVPISLLVSLEMVKFFQGMLITADDGTYARAYDIRTNVQTSALNEELGQVEYIFSDKTGTLTKNLMDFKSLTVAKHSYGVQQTMTQDDLSRFPNVTNVDFKDKQFFLDSANAQHKAQIHEFLICLSLCHTVITDIKDGTLIYEASSPDELALLNFARFSGYLYEGMDQANNMVISIKGDQRRFQLLHVLEFNSTRKRMSVIVQDSNNQIVLYTKGADSVIEKRMKQIEPSLKQSTWQHLQEYAAIGLRTLILAKRVIPMGVYQSWIQRYNAACSAIQNRDELMMQAQDEIEVELDLVGGTAIEDKLQDEVGATISYLKEAGIKIWVLTGDKIETAINIGYSCALLNDSLKQILVDGVTEAEVAASLQQAHQQVQNPDKYALVISGDALIVAMQPQYSAQVMRIADKCDGVIACRVSPKQKQEIVALVRHEKPKVTTLAIGDGANDVNMITAAHVGIGIKGVEGQQAARASDYSIGEFRILRRLTLFHGRESYRKNSILVNFNFFKNMMLVLPQFWWAINNGFSAVNLYDPWMYQSYNLFYTSLPIVLFAIFDSEFSGDYLIQNPGLYEIGLKSKMFNYSQFLYWVVNGAVQAAAVGLLSYTLLESTSVYNGYMNDFWAIGTAVLGYSTLNGNFKVVMFSNSFTPAIIIGLVGSVFMFIIMYAIISTSMVASNIYNTMSASYAHLPFYFATLIIFGTTSLIDYAITRWHDFTQYSGMIQHDKVYLPLFKQHIELQDDQYSTTKLRMAGPQAPDSGSRLHRGYTGFAFSQDEK